MLSFALTLLTSELSLSRVAVWHRGGEVTIEPTKYCEKVPFHIIITKIETKSRNLEYKMTKKSMDTLFSTWKLELFDS